MSQTTKQLGNWGEAIAADYLQREGFELVSRNWRCVVGEIDIIACKDGVWHFVEVKTRRGSGVGSAIEALTRRKAEKMWAVVERFWAERVGEGKDEDVACSLDLIAVQLSADGRLLNCTHLRDVVSAW